MPWTKDGPSAHFTSMCVHTLRKFARTRGLPFTGAERHMLRGAADILERQAQRAVIAKSGVGTPMTKAELRAQMTAYQREQANHNIRTDSVAAAAVIPFESPTEHIDDEEFD